MTVVTCICNSCIKLSEHSTEFSKSRPTLFVCKRCRNYYFLSLCIFYLFIYFIIIIIIIIISFFFFFCHSFDLLHQYYFYILTSMLVTDIKTLNKQRVLFSFLSLMYKLFDISKVLSLTIIILFN